MRVVTEATVDDDELGRILRPRTGFVLERGEGAGRFSLDQGTMRAYERVVTHEPAGESRHRVRQVVECQLAAPFFGWFFFVPARLELGRLHPNEGSPWWAPPQRLGTTEAFALDALAAVSFILGYVATLVTQTFTYTAREFGANRPAQAVALAVLRADVVVSIVLVALADRRGRRTILVLACTLGCVATATGALMPSLAWFTVSQLVAKGFVSAAVVVVTIMSAEDMPAGTRAYALSILAMAGGLGAGLAVVLLPVAGLGTRGWRVLFAVAVLGVLLMRGVARSLKETKRFRASHVTATMRGHGRRLLLLGGSGLLLALFTIPASEFQNEFLRKERHFSPTHISLFTILTVTPIAIGIVAGGRLADVRGRRLVGAVGLAGGVGFTVVQFYTRGWPMWTWSVMASVVGGLVAPALGVYGPELFPTSLRGKANGVIAAMSRIGSVIGLLVAGRLAHRFGSLSPAFAILAVGPAIVVVLVLVAYPETAMKDLDELNPEDAKI